MISIIIPLYNLCGEGRYLQKCLDSIIEQTYTDFEVLLMENGSTDDTIDVANEYVKKDKRFKLFILSEQGIANARNEGLDRAIGEYICFIDGDDFISYDFLEYLYNTISSSPNIDIAIAPCSLLYIKDNKIKPFTSDYTPRIITDGNIASLFSDGMVWAKLFRRSIIENNYVRFDKSLYGVDDVLFSAELKLLAHNIAITDKGVYYYIQGRNGQASTSKMKDSANSHLLLVHKLELLFTKYGKYNEYKGYIDKIFISIFIGYDFALTPLAKMSINDANDFINKNLDKISATIPDQEACPRWMVRWFNMFVKSAQMGGGARFIKFMRIFRNIVLQPLSIKYKGDKFVIK